MKRNDSLSNSLSLAEKASADAKYKTAIKHYKQHLAANPDDVAVFSKVADLFESAKDDFTAIEWWQKAAVAQNDPIAYVRKAKLENKLLLHDDAEATLDKALLLSPDCAAAHKEKLYTLCELESPKLAAAAEAFLITAPADADGLAYLGRALTWSKHYDLAEMQSAAHSHLSQTMPTHFCSGPYCKLSKCNLRQL